MTDTECLFLISSLTLIFLPQYRGKSDWKNSVISGCITGGAIGFRGWWCLLATVSVITVIRLNLVMQDTMFLEEYTLQTSLHGVVVKSA